jgi:predicted GNAT family acetyltransferase
MMNPHILDRPALAALRTRHSSLAQSKGRALRYDPDVAPFIVAEDNDDASLADLGGLIDAGRFAIMLQRERSPLPPGAAVELATEGVQMIAAALAPPQELHFIPLADADAPEMVALAALTKPGPFLPRTHELGGYIGIRDNGRLVAMAGERLKVPGYTEVSAVCTHPDYRGRGYAGALTLAVAHRIVARGETPFLHTFASNVNAIRLYEKLGFVLRTPMTVTVLRRA